MPTTTRRRDREDEAVQTLGLATQRWRALGTSAQVVVTDPASLAPAVDAVRRVLDAIDLAASRFRADSELTAVNTMAGAWVPVSPLFARALRVALDAAAATDGLVDPTVGAALVGLGYDRTFRLVPADAPAIDVVVAPIVGWRHVELDDRALRVRIPRDARLDLGATAKGLAADLAAAAAHRTTERGVLVNLGGDIATAGTAPPVGWPVAVGDVTDPDAADETGPVQTIALHTGALATSSTSARRWRRGGSTMHHIIDPSSGLPASAPWRTVSVVATTCAEANAASTAAVVAGRDAVRWLTRHGHTARLVSTAGVVTTLGGWPTPEVAA